jgi:N-formylglutamate amidohydrolase
MGVIYNQTSDLQPLRRELSAAERGNLLETYYRPHHEALRQEVLREVSHRGRCLLIDGHSFPKKALPYEDDHFAVRPEICIGTDSFHTPVSLSGRAVTLFTKTGFDVTLNSPFAGALVPMQFYKKNSDIHALMIEVRRDLYMDETTGERGERFVEFRKRFHSVLSELIGADYSTTC